VANRNYSLRKCPFRRHDRWTPLREYQPCYRLNRFLVVRLAKEVVLAGHRFSVRVQIISMVEQDWNTNEKIAGESPGTPKKQYQDPAFRHERVFETMALHCGKVQDTNFQCRFNRHTS
jgi:hypothetical protein